MQLPLSAIMFCQAVDQPDRQLFLTVIGNVINDRTDDADQFSNRSPWIEACLVDEVLISDHIVIHHHAKASSADRGLAPACPRCVAVVPATPRSQRAVVRSRSPAA